MWARAWRAERGVQALLFGVGHHQRLGEPMA
jgi:hypothetical protein